MIFRPLYSAITGFAGASSAGVAVTDGSAVGSSLACTTVPLVSTSTVAEAVATRAAVNDLRITSVSPGWVVVG
ncbi:hypothetical protein GCM10010313_51380 [Streptomyces violarus]|nr:hypothetical protein GCM10010313_51380 [Streptomyces violarus]